MFEQFPYADVHQLNLDWIIKIAKDFLDQYTHIQELINDGIENIDTEATAKLQELDDRATALENALNAWYTDHSEDIAQQLAQALNDMSTALTNNIASFNTAAQQAAEAAIASIPSEYSQFYTDALRWVRYTTASDDALTLDNGVYGIGTAANHPANLPSDFGTSAGLLICPDRSGTGNTSKFRILFSAYTRRAWYYTGYSWTEFLTSTTLADYFKYRGVLPDQTDPRDATEGLYNIIPSNTYLNLPADFDTSRYAWVFVMRSSGTGPYVTLFNGIKYWISMSASGWSEIGYNTLGQEKITLIGDSWTQQNYTATKNWTVLMADNGMNVVNLGAGGTGFARAVDGVRYINQIPNIPGDSTIIGVSGSFNDLAAGVPIGYVTDTGNSSVCGYINAFFDELFTQFPVCPVICYILGPWVNANYNSQVTRLYCERLEEICKIRGIPFKNMLTASGLRPWDDANKLYYYNNDGVHPNNEGYKLIFRHILPFFMESIRNTNDMYQVTTILNAD